MSPTRVRVSADGAELVALADRLTAPDGVRRLVGIAGEPGAGKSTLAAALARLCGPRAAVVPLDGFHLADVELARQGLLARKGAPETFDPWGYAALLRRLQDRPPHAVYAPGFERDLEQPLAGALAVGPEVSVVLTEGNYLLLDGPGQEGWATARAQLDEVWSVTTDPGRRRERLVARHVAFGKAPAAAAAWVEEVDEPNARLVARHAAAADLVVDLDAWSGAEPPFLR